MDPDTKAPILDAEGKAVMEEREVEIPMFRPVKVFDVSQTDGKPLPELASSLSGNVQNYRGFHGGPAPVRAGAALRGADGRQHGRVFLAGPAAHRPPGRHERGADRFPPPSMRSPTASCTTTPRPRRKRPGPVIRSRPRRKTATPRRWRPRAFPMPSASITVSRPARTASGYIANWSQGKELPELRASLETINKAGRGTDQ